MTQSGESNISIWKKVATVVFRTCYLILRAQVLCKISDKYNQEHILIQAMQPTQDGVKGIYVIHCLLKVIQLGWNEQYLWKVSTFKAWDVLITYINNDETAE